MAKRKAARPRRRSSSQPKKKASGVRKAAASRTRIRAATPKTRGSKKRAPARKKTARRPAPRLRRSAASGRLREATASQAGKARKAPALNRERRIAPNDDLVPTPPSSLDLDRSASAARSGRRELHERLTEHTETSPAITGGDIDADWESAYSVGDEAPGGDNPTPDQDIVDDIGRAIGVEYEDNEELKGETKISARDKKRWELDPASSEDYNDR